MDKDLPDGPTGSLAGLSSIAHALRSAHGDRELLALVTREAMVAINGDHASLQQWSGDDETWLTLVNVGDLGPFEDPFPSTENYHEKDFPDLLEAVRTGGYVTDLDETPSRINAALHDLLRAEGKHSCLSVPVHLRGGLWGELYFSRSATRPSFNAHDLELARIAASQVSAVVSHLERMSEFHALAYRDALTGLSNRRALEDALDAAVLRHIAEGTPIAVMVADVNGLKRTNDTLGHDAGDRLLIACAEDLRKSFEDIPDAVLARMGGDEFCVVLTGDPSTRMSSLADEFGANVLTHSPDGVSYGLASTTESLFRLTSTKDLLRAADAAQYRSKLLSRRSEGAGDASELALKDRRRFSDSTARGLDEVVEAVERLHGGATLARLASVANLLARRYDAAAWFISQENRRTLITLDGIVLRQEKAMSPQFMNYFSSLEGYPVADFPQSARAVDGSLSITRLGDPEADDSELALVLAGGFQYQILAGGRNREGGWLVELFGDEQSAPVETWANLLRAGVAMALVGIGTRNEATLLDRMGGEAVLRPAMLVMHGFIAADPLLAGRFEGVDMARLLDSKVSFISAVLGGSEAYLGRGIGDSHQPLKVTNNEFRAFLSHFDRSLRTLGVAPDLISAATDRLKQLRSLVAPDAGTS